MMTENKEEATVGPVEITRIMDMIPHRYPMLMVDRVEDIVPDVSAVGIKNVTVNEPHFVGHFPVAPVMPGVLIIESMAQTSAVLFAVTLGKHMEGKVVLFHVDRQLPLSPPDHSRRPGQGTCHEVAGSRAVDLAHEGRGICRR